MRAGTLGVTGVLMVAKELRMVHHHLAAAAAAWATAAGTRVRGGAEAARCGAKDRCMRWQKQKRAQG